MTSRTMPAADVVGRNIVLPASGFYEQLASGSQPIGQFTNVFFTAGPFAGLPQKVIDLGRSITKQF